MPHRDADLKAQARDLLRDLEAMERDYRCMVRRRSNDRKPLPLPPQAISVMVALSTLGALLT